MLNRQPREIVEQRVARNLHATTIEFNLRRILRAVAQHNGIDPRIGHQQV